jgi:hypothetical protein
MKNDISIVVLLHTSATVLLVTTDTSFTFHSYRNITNKCMGATKYQYFTHTETSPTNVWAQLNINHLHTLEWKPLITYFFRHIGGQSPDSTVISNSSYVTGFKLIWGMSMTLLNRAGIGRNSLRKFYKIIKKKRKVTRNSLVCASPVIFLPIRHECFMMFLLLTVSPFFL